MKRLLLILFLLPLLSQGADIYVSASGSDANSGTSSAAPIQTIAKLNTLAKSAGTHVYFHRGETFYGTINITQSGTASFPIVLDAYGTGADPVLTGFTTVTGWTSLGGGIYESTNMVSSLATCNMFAINGVLQERGRWPNAGTANGGYATIDAVGTTGITDAGINTAFTSGEIRLRSADFIIDSLTGTRSGTTINFVRAFKNTPKVGWGYVLTNSPNVLDQYGEWYYNPTTKKIRFYSGTTPTGTIQVATVDNVINAKAVSYVTIQNLSIQGANLNGIVFGGANNNLKVLNCSITLCGNSGFEETAGGFINCAFLDNVVADCGNHGINISNAGTGNQVIGNTIKRCGMWVAQGGAGSNMRLGIISNTGGQTITDNNVDSTGSAGIKARGSNWKVNRNVVKHFAMRLQDCGGIYSYNSSMSNYTNCELKDNIVDGAGSGAPEGANTSTVRVDGIYMDDGVCGVVMTGNTVVNCAHYGIYLHNPQNMNLQNNTAYNNGVSQVLIAHDRSNFWSAVNITLKNNIFFSATATQKCFIDFDKSDSLRYRYVVRDSNYFARPILETQTLRYLKYVYTTSAVQTDYTFALWKGAYNYDLHSHNSPRGITSTDSLRLIVNATAVAATYSLAQSYMDVTGAVYAGSLTLPAHRSIILMANGNAVATPITPVDTTTTTTTGGGMDTSYIPETPDTTAPPITPVYWKDTTYVSTTGYTVPKTPTKVYQWINTTKGGVINLPDPTTVPSTFAFTFVNYTAQPIQCNRYLYTKIGKNWKFSSYQGTFNKPKVTITVQSGKYKMTTI